MTSISSLSPAALATATAALRGRIEAAIGPVDQFSAETDEGGDYIGFAKPATSLLITVNPYEDGGWAVQWQDGAMVSRAPTPIEAMELAKFRRR